MKKIIVLIEDNPQDELLTIRALRKHQFLQEIVVLRDGEEALEWLFKQGRHRERDPLLVPQVILLDIKLPKIDGLEVLRRLRDHAETRRLPVVLLTTSSEERDIVSGYDSGANSYVRKPVDYNEFAEAVRSLGLYWLLVNAGPPDVRA